MSDTILGGDFTLYYLDENRQKRIKWSGSSGTRTANALYSACQDLFDESLQMDDGVPMSAQTPVEYTIGQIDAGDLNPWYISYDAMERITGGAVKTSGWTRDLPGDGTGAIGIVVASVTSNTIVTADIGYDITHADGDAGTLLDVIEAGTTDYLIIRPDTNALVNDFNSTSGTLTCNTNTATQAAAATTGEQIWANLYSIGTIEADTHIYVYQGLVSDATRARVLAIASTTEDWWGDGHIDRCYFIRDFKAADAPLIDGGYLSVLAHKYTNLYDNFEVSTSTTSGGRNPIPLATAPDLDNTTGYKSITYTNATGNWTAGDEILGTDSGARAIITSIVNPGSTQTVHYYLIDDPLTDFNTAVEVCDNQDDTGAGSKNDQAPADQGPALASWYTNNAAPSCAYGTDPEDIDDDGTEEGYGIKLNCNSNPLTEVYEWVKYTFRRGNTGTGDSDGIEAEQYVGGVVYLDYSGSVSGGTIDEGDDVKQATTNAMGIVISHDLTNKEILLRDTRGTFNTTNTVTSQDAGAGSITPDNAAAAFAAKKQAPLGTFAGGIFFGARGVVLSNWVAGDENSFKLTDTAGNARQRPQAYSITVSNLFGGAESAITHDRLAVFRLTGSGGSIDKTEYSSTGAGTIGDATLVVDGTIAQDVPGKTTGGVLRIRDEDNSNKEYRIRYSSWATSTFTLAAVDPITLAAGTDTDTIVATGSPFTNVKRGDLVNNETEVAISYVTEVTDANTLQISPAITGQEQTDTITINTLPIAMDTLDDVFVPLIDQYAAAATAAVSINYDTTIYYRVIVRNVAASSPNGPIVPFATDDSMTAANRSVATIRTIDTIYS